MSVDLVDVFVVLAIVALLIFIFGGGRFWHRGP